MEQPFLFMVESVAETIKKRVRSELLLQERRAILLQDQIYEEAQPEIKAIMQMNVKM